MNINQIIQEIKWNYDELKLYEIVYNLGYSHTATINFCNNIEFDKPISKFHNYNKMTLLLILYRLNSSVIEFYNEHDIN